MRASIRHVLCLDEAGAAGAEEKKSTSKNKKKAAAEKKAKGGVDAKTVGSRPKTSPVLGHRPFV